MQKILLLLIFTTILFSKEGDYERKIYENIFPKIFHSQNVLVFVNDDNVKKTLQKSTLLSVVKKCMDADILIGNNFKEEDKSCQEKPIFALNYRIYKNSRGIIGAFYWRKGRPQITFSKKAFKKHKLEIPQSLQKYVQ